MDVTPHILCLDAQATAIIDRRWSVVSRHLHDWLSRDELHHTLLAGIVLSPGLSQWLDGLERRVGNTSSRDLVGFRNAWQTWCQSYLLPLARDLELYAQAEQSVIRTLWGRGSFDTPQAASPDRIRIVVVVQPLARPEFAGLIAQVLSALYQVTDQEKGIALLVEHGICRNQLHAIAVMEALDRQEWQSLVNIRAFALARRVLLGLHDHGLVGLLIASDHPLAEDLLFIESRRSVVTKLAADAESVLGQLRSEVAALYTAINEALAEISSGGEEPEPGRERLIHYAGYPARLKPSKSAHRSPRARDKQLLLRWETDLLLQPRYSGYRVKLREVLNGAPSLQSVAVERIAEQLGYSSDRAAECLDDLIDGGLDALIERCCNVSPGTALFTHLIGKIDIQLAAIVPDTRKEMLSALADLQRAIADVMPGSAASKGQEESGDEQYTAAVMYAQRRISRVEAPLSLNTLLNAPVGGGRRYGISARISIGVARLSKAKSRGRRKSRALRLFRRRRPEAQQKSISARDRTLQALIERFAELRGLTVRQAADRLRATVTYGMIGMLQRDTWPKVIDQRLVEQIVLFKFGRLDGGVDWSQVGQTLARLGVGIHLPPLSTPVIRAVAATFPKDRRWPGGAGKMMAGVQWRVAQRLSGRPRLHRLWRVLPISLEYLRRTRGFDEGWFAVLVLDMGCGRPVGVWTQRGRPGLEAVGLALYQSIWHPGAPDWPLRGIPEVIELDEQLIDGSLKSLQSGADWLMATIRVVPSYRERYLWERLEEFRTSTEAENQDRLKFADKLIKKLLPTFGRELITKLRATQDAGRTVQDGVLGYLRFGRGDKDKEASFYGHRPAPIPNFIEETGLLMPSYSAPAAGWLLPITGELRTQRNAVMVDSVRYTSLWFQCEPGLTVTRRAFPFLYAGMRRGFFVQQHGDPLWLEADREEG